MLAVLKSFFIVGLVISGRLVLLNNKDNDTNRQGSHHHRSHVDANQASTAALRVEMVENTSAGSLSPAGFDAAIFGQIDDNGNLTSSTDGGDIFDIGGHNYSNNSTEEEDTNNGNFDGNLAEACGGEDDSYCTEPANYPYTAVSNALVREKALISLLREVSVNTLR
jgi:hypothetical protein